MPKRRSTENKRCEFNSNLKSSIGKNIDHFDGLRSIKNLGAGDSYYISNFIKSKKEKSELFSKLLSEIEFEQMFNFTPNCSNNKVLPIPRLVTGQTYKNNLQCNKYPIYRMPGCNEKNIETTNWTLTVEYIRTLASKKVKQEINHCICTLYKNENDSLGFHKDKLLDLCDNSYILSISFGAARPILFYKDIKGKKVKQHRQTIILQPGSLIAIGPKTNKLYKHAIPKLKQCVGPRISLSMRSIHTLVEENKNDENNYKIIGKGKEFQNLNWPFSKNYDNINEYDNKTIQQINIHKKNANDMLNSLRKEFENTNTDHDNQQEETLN